MLDNDWLHQQLHARQLPEVGSGFLSPHFLIMFYTIFLCRPLTGNRKENVGFAQVAACAYICEMTHGYENEVNSSQSIFSTHLTTRRPLPCSYHLISDSLYLSSRSSTTSSTACLTMELSNSIHRFDKRFLYIEHRECTVQL